MSQKPQILLLIDPLKSTELIYPLDESIDIENSKLSEYSEKFQLELLTFKQNMSPVTFKVNKISRNGLTALADMAQAKLHTKAVWAFSLAVEELRLPNGTTIKAPRTDGAIPNAEQEQAFLDACQDEVGWDAMVWIGSKALELSKLPKGKFRP